MKHPLLHGLPCGVCETRRVTNDSLTNEVCMCLLQPIHYCLTLSDQPGSSFLGEIRGECIALIVLCQKCWKYCL